MNYKEIYDKVQQGNADALPAYIDLKKYVEDVSQYLDALKEQATDEFVNKWGGKEQEINGAMVSRHAGGRYNYNDVPGWKRAKDGLTMIEQKAQMAYKADGSFVDEETGEVITPAKYIANKESISIKLIK